MKKIFLSLCLIGLIFIGQSGAGGAEKPPLQVAIYPFQAVGISDTIATVITNAVYRELVNSKKLIVRDQQSTKAAIDQIGLSQSGHCSEDACTVEAGKIMKAQKLIMGSVEMVMENYYTVSMRVVDVQTARTEYQVQRDCESCKNNVEIRNFAVRVVKENILVYLETGKIPEEPAPVQPVAPTTPVAQSSEMVLVPAGDFMMGCNEAVDTKCGKDEMPYHKVYLDAFYIDKYEYPNQAGAMPKVEVSWSEAQSICRSQGKRLPTEAEWEKAARGTDGRTYPWGEGLDCSKVNYAECGNEGAKPAGSYPSGASPYGAMDMAGNVWEWTADWYDTGYYSRSPSSSPKGPDSGSARVLRGGSWYDLPSNLRASVRNWFDPDDRFGSMGVRCVR